MRFGILAGTALVLGFVNLAACDQAQPTDTPASQSPTLAFTNARLALPAVKGNPGAVYFDIANTGKTDLTFRTAEVAGAKSAMMHAMNGGSMDDLMVQPVKAGETVHFAPGGSHVMAMDLSDTLKPGGTTDVTLHLGNGSKAVFPAKIIAAGDAR